MYLFTVVVTFYSVATYGVSHSCWRVCLGILAYIFDQIKQECHLTYIESEPNKWQTEKIVRLRKIHQCTCDLLKDLNEIYSLQILASLTCLFVLLAFRSYSIIMHAADIQLNGVVLFDLFAITFSVYTLLTIITKAHSCVLQVEILIKK